MCFAASSGRVRHMKDRVDLRLSPTQAIKLRRVVEARKQPSRGDALRLLIDEECERLGIERGDVNGDETRRES